MEGGAACPQDALFLWASRMGVLGTTRPIQEGSLSSSVLIRGLKRPSPSLAFPPSRFSRTNAGHPLSKMKAVHLAFTVAAVLAAVVSGVLFFLIGNQKEEMQQQLTTANGRISVMESRSTELASQRDLIEAQARALEEQLGESRARGVSLEARSTQLARELQQARQELVEKADAEQNQQREIAQLRRDLVQARSTLLEQGSQAEVAALQDRINSLEAELGRRGGSGSPSATGRTVQITPVNSPRDFGIQNASVLSVGTKSAFVVLNIGSAHGARPGIALAVDRQGLSLARLQISEVNENYSIAQVEAGSLTGKLRVGDNAIILN